MRKFLGTLALFVLAAAPRLSAQIDISGPFPCTAATLAAYEARETFCTVGTNLEFGPFQFSANGNGSLADLDTLITVTPNADGMGGGFTFSGWQSGVTGPTQTATYTIGYTYGVFGDPPAMDASSIGMDPVSGSVVIGEEVCPLRGGDCFGLGVNSANDQSDGCGGLPNLIEPCWVNNRSLPNLTDASSVNTITLTGDGGTNGGGFDALTVAYDVIETDPAPEPAAWLLGLGGLGVIGLVRRYRCMGNAT